MLFRHCVLHGVVDPTAGSKQSHCQEIEMTTEKSVEKKPALYWITLAIMFAAFFAIVLA